MAHLHRKILDATQFTSFSCSFWQKFGQIIGWHSPPPWENLDPPLGEGEGVYEFNERDMKYVLEKYVVVVKNLLNLLRGKLNPIEFVNSCTGML